MSHSTENRTPVFQKQPVLTSNNLCDLYCNAVFVYSGENKLQKINQYNDIYENPKIKVLFGRVGDVPDEIQVWIRDIVEGNMLVRDNI